ncbi:MAG: hypothetical protein COW88_01810 [Candidatus Lloydbacteria bacterium CG22_combo_CG10-13_8_21_14_all_47_15]|uniref:Right handed beta helix domain-containing protein n=1 Tax=Candidatus Lloydbacteria bacterium CG22_combo_CG10-13_8_21_14_all_47_15 TaxID=1974635 RepID=A0A2H0CUT8_9BACT|nr:MAG: hypothetical protein COW88_01810 [Candidatus Lloydbacteria bacterium CG22_combo_CG10-13_8_21_14_all_47_15]
MISDMNIRHFFRQKKVRYPLLVACVFFAVIFSLVIFQNPLEQRSASFNAFRTSILGNPIARHFLHAYHSLRKLPDIFFAPYYLVHSLAPSHLPVYDMFITTQNMVFLNANLPADPVGGYLESDNRVWATGGFAFGGYQDEVKVKYRGTNANHWNSFQKSIRVKFPSKNLFQGMKSLDFIIPYDRKYFAEPLNLYRAQKLGLTTLDMSFARLRINGVDMGVYLTVERFTDEWLNKRPVSDALSVFNLDDSILVGESADANDSSVFSVVRKDGTYYFTRHTGQATADTAVRTFYELLDGADDGTFKRLIPNILDMDKFYAFNVVSILAGSSHFNETFGNVFLIFNPDTGKFEFSPWDLEMTAIDTMRGDHITDISSRILGIPEFREARNKLLGAYISDDSNLMDDLSFYDDWYDKTKADFFTDGAKLYNNFQFIRQVGVFRDIAVDNFHSAKAVLEYGDSYYTADKGDDPDKNRFFPEGEFKRFSESGSSIDEFIRVNPSFVKRDALTVALLPGSYYFGSDIIVPRGVRVQIDAGATLYMGEGVSVISYSPIVARGRSFAPIRVMRANTGREWGTFAVVNTEEKSIVENVFFDGGSGESINGITFTGMVAFHNASVEISDTTFSNSGDDDALNIKYGEASIRDSRFEHTFSDAIDVDFVSRDTKIVGNVFSDIGFDGGGDAIDLSWSDILAENNQVYGCSDKGISVGEGARPIIRENTITGCEIGIAVKDNAVADISGNRILDTKIGIVAYRKKAEFANGGAAVLSENIFENVTIPLAADALSLFEGAEFPVQEYRYIK